MLLTLSGKVLDAMNGVVYMRDINNNQLPLPVFHGLNSIFDGSATQYISVLKTKIHES